MKHVILYVLLFFTLTGFSQLPLKFDKYSHDYGSIQEDGGKVQARFEFTNTGTKAIHIVQVRSSCGCTASDWTRNAVEPGGKGFVTAEYDPINRPGPFNKSLDVLTSESNNTTISLYIKGTVTPKKRTIAIQYGFSMGVLKFKTNHLSFGEVKTNQIKTDSFAVYNNGGLPVKIGFPELPAFLSAKAKPTVLDPGNEGFIIVYYDGSKRGDLGFLLDRLTLDTDDEEQPRKTLNISANLVQDFSHLSPAELKKAPNLQFEKRVYDFGTIQQGQIIEFEIAFKNDGKQVLKIHRIRPSCGCLSATPLKTELKKKQKSSLKIVFNSAGKIGRQQYTMNVISNSPSAPDMILTVTGNVE